MRLTFSELSVHATARDRGKVPRSRAVKLCSFAMLFTVLSAAAWAECTVETIETCTRDDPAAAEQLLLKELSKSRKPVRLARLGEFYRTAPEQFRDRTKALWYLQRASDAGDPSAAVTLAKMLASAENAAARADPLQKPPVAGQPDPDTGTAALSDPPSTLSGERLTLKRVMSITFAAGFRTEEQLLPALATAISESALWTAARNWHPERGFRPASDTIATLGPPEVWRDGRQMHSDRGLWQIASWAWGHYPDSVTDDPVAAAAVMFILTRGGTDFLIWDSFVSGRAQEHYDRSINGWPRLRPVVRAFLATELRTAAGSSGASEPNAAQSGPVAEVLTKDEVALAADAISAVKFEVARLAGLTNVKSLKVVTIEPALLVDSQVDAAVSASRDGVSALRAALSANAILRAHLAAQEVSVHNVLGVDVTSDGRVTVYAQSSSPDAG